MRESIHIVSVDDEPFNLLLIEELASLIGFEVTSFEKPQKALSYIETHPVDILLVDYMMPQMNGIELMKSCHAVNSDLLMVMITAVNDNEELKIEALEAGATDFLSKPFNPSEFQVRLRNLAKIRSSQHILADFNKRLQEEVELATAKLIQREHEALEVLSNTAEYKDPETASHIARVAHYSRMLAEKHGLDKPEQEIIFYSSPLHDIGKVGTNDAILLKPGKLTDEEFETMKEHAIIGYNILHKSENPYLAAGAIIAATHHEKYNGRGYPKGLKGEEIHLYGRITAIADVFDALTSERPYKKAWSFEDAMALIEKEKGEHFDPLLAQLFIDNVAEVREIFERFQE